MVLSVTPASNELPHSQIRSTPILPPNRRPWAVRSSGQPLSADRLDLPEVHPPHHVEQVNPCPFRLQGSKLSPGCFVLRSPEIGPDPFQSFTDAIPAVHTLGRPRTLWPIWIHVCTKDGLVVAHRNSRRSLLVENLRSDRRCEPGPLDHLRDDIGDAVPVAFRRLLERHPGQ